MPREKEGKRRDKKGNYYDFEGEKSANKRI